MPNPTLTYDAHRVLEGPVTVVSVVTLEGDHVCRLLEDQLRGWGEKVWAGTCIPAGRYRMDPAHQTPMARRYYDRFPWFRGLPALTWASPGPMVPTYTSLRVHPGETHLDTLGCPLTAVSVVKDASGDWQARGSAIAFRHFCEPLYQVWDQVGTTYLHIHDDRIRL